MKATVLHRRRDIRKNTRTGKDFRFFEGKIPKNKNKNEISEKP